MSHGMVYASSAMKRARQHLPPLEARSLQSCQRSSPITRIVRTLKWLVNRGSAVALDPTKPSWTSIIRAVTLGNRYVCVCVCSSYSKELQPGGPPIYIEPLDLKTKFSLDRLDYVRLKYNNILHTM